MKEIKKLQKIAKTLSKLKLNGPDLYISVNNSKLVEEVISNNNLENEFKPVKFLRYLIAKKIEEGINIDSKLISDLKDNINNKDVSKHISLNKDQQKSLDSYKKKPKGMFPNWKHDFSVLFPFIHSTKSETACKDNLRFVAEKIIDDLALKDVKLHKVGFQGSNNYGKDSVWGALIPKDAANVQQAFQLFFSVNSDGIAGGLYMGHKVEGIAFENSEPFESVFQTYDQLKNELNKNVEKWVELNANLLSKNPTFSLIDIMKKVKDRIKKSSHPLSELSWKEPKRNYFQILLFDSLSSIHYEVIKRGSNEFPYSVELHFESRKELLQKFRHLQVADGEFEVFEWMPGKDKDNLSIRFNKQFRNNSDIINEISNALMKLYDVYHLKILDRIHEVLWHKRISKLNKTEVENLFSVIDMVISKFSLDKNDMRLVFSCSKRISLQIGHRVIIGRQKKNKYYLISLKNNNSLGKDFDTFQTGNILLKNVRIQDVLSQNESLIDACKIELEVGDEFPKFDNPYFRKAAFNLKDRSHLIKSEIKIFTKSNNMVMNSKNPINQILFGPPGTGKTYNTINKAIQIVDPEFYQNNHTNRDELKKRFNELLITDFDTMDGRIVFTTFHQSMSYEDFVEGIKPEVVNENLSYNVSDGIFKKICEIAGYKHSIESEGGEGMLNWSNKQYNDSNFYKMSLGDTQDAEESEIYSYCIKNNCISLGFGATSDFSGLNREDIYKQVKENSDQLFAADALNRLINKMSIGDYVIISNGNLYARALGKITSDYYFDDNTEIEHNHFRNVEWIFTDENIHVSEFLKKRFSQQSIYHIDKSYLKEEYFKSKDKLSSNDKKSYALIIDEINRGNISSIFGELITLIEDDKRRGNKEQLTVTLPYSKKPFSVPDNIFLIGTMNTADRSVEALDTALRRRFEFEEMLPDSSLLSNITCEGIDFKDLLNTINGRIETLLDKDHQIGHSYFMNSNNTLSITDLRGIFKNKIMPLLQEYFYGDFGKIGLVLGDSFIKEPEKSDFAEFDYDDRDLIDERKVYQLADIDKLEATDFISIYEKSE